ncbi:MAG TPA: phosphoribosyltransferase family protein [Armatimonadota bacterium]|nr:phosphoribosyltransferase family protein [Armatimonadota bacterium]
MIFEDRVDAGKRLAARLEQYRGPDTIVLAIPRGGVVVGYQVATALRVPLDVVIPRKIGAPGQPELAIGAIGDDVSALDEETIRYLGVSEEYIRDEIERQRRELERRWRLYHGDRPFPDIEGKTVILVDDGVATGYTTVAAARTIRRKHPAELVLAVPVAPPESLVRLIPEVDDLVVLETPQPFFSVGSWYYQFEQTTDEEVIDLLHRAGESTGA